MNIVFPRILRCASCIALLGLSASVCQASAIDDAQALITRGDLTSALQVLDDEIKIQPTDADARFTRGIVLAKMNRVPEAIKDFSDLTHDFPKLPEPYNNLAVLYAQTGDYDKARTTLESALATNPSYETAHENLGDVYAALAGEAYGHALELDQGNAGLKYKLALIAKLNSSGSSAPANPPVAVATATKPGVANTASTQPGAEAIDPTAGLAPNEEAPADGDRAAVLDALTAWVNAWSSRDIDRYLAAYSPDFKPDGGISYEAWLEQRRERLAKATYIDVKVSQTQVSKTADGRLRVEFLQSYHSDAVNDRIRKKLEFGAADGGWKILRESVVR